MWSEFKSNTATLRFVQRAIGDNRLGHAYLITGDSAQKEAVALHIAAALNCTHDARNDRPNHARNDREENGDACGKCAACRKIFEGNHPDVRVVRPELKSRQISIEKVRELERSSYLKAMEARTKVGIIIDADRLTQSAQDAFLKTLEEPPKNTVFLLLTAEPQQLKYTILSRCLRINLFQEEAAQAGPREKKLREALSGWKANAGRITLFQTYQLADALQEALTEARKEAEDAVESEYEGRGYETFEGEQAKRLEAEKDAAATARYRRERTQLVRVLQSHFRGWVLKEPDNRGYIKACEAIERLHQRLGRNMNEGLALEVALLELVDACGESGEPAAVAGRA